ncbi:hypothetical protein NQ176_g5183 [Zarea fungicola]|uniref:Uncharacterized protein n=1 Tax=Zarea fungicola TaxID=93591 RepID=A0ACC1NAI8_9HYPO|nr:hypothetical protein NQ176_g5183 [Lecanicillium fungicola]
MTQSFVQFRYGTDAEQSLSTKPVAQSKSVTLMEQVAITSKLEQIKLARRKEKQMHKGPASMGYGGSFTNGDSKTAPEDQKEVVIGWDHLVKALDNTRASISQDERSRLERIYHEFVAGRSGKMKDGQGSTEIGGRSSLM